MTLDWLVLSAALLSGLLGGVHCAAMCGAIATSLSFGQKAASPATQWLHALQPNLGRILESLAAHAPTTKDVGDLTEKVRADIGRAVIDRFRDPTGRVRAIVLDPRLEVELRRSVQNHQLVLDPARLEGLTLRLMAEVRKAAARGFEAALLCDSLIRRAVHHALARTLPDLAVVAYQEIPTDVLMEPVAVIRPEELVTTGPSAVAALFEPQRT